jgi:NAD-dependent dihydropyrimidine dehydrogenase PreA subunit
MNDAQSPRDCKGEAGRVAPEIDRDRCEGKADCLRVCPYGVFEVGVLPAAERASLSWLGRVKGWAHGYKQAFVVKSADCHACQACVDACPEDAIRLVAVRS